MKSNVIREKFLSFFEQHQHQRVASSSMIPSNDATLLFTNAGMVQFKETFLGQETRTYQRATSSQRCLRAGGKHNDLENVGYTARHHTFFEMLGNFSFGDYFKHEAIEYAWTFLTDVLGLPKEKLWVTVYKDDDEAAAIWEKEIGVEPNRIIRCGDKDNFWSMGDTGPCGPCTEIFYDHGEEIPGGPPGSPEEDGDRYIEIWNLVFMQYNRSQDGTMVPLPKPSVDTGMGLERLAAVLQGVHDNYETDLFLPLLKEIATLSGIKDIQQTSARVIADHIRSCSFLIADGVIPANEGRGYVLRRIIRRAIRHGNKLGMQGTFFYKLVGVLVAEMGDAYPELITAQAQIETLLKQEEQQFARTLEQGLQIFEQHIKTLKSDCIPGDIVFKLYDTYGFPIDLTADIARERNLTVDVEGFENAMQKQRAQSKAANQFSVDYNEKMVVDDKTDFAGYEVLSSDAMVVSLFKENIPVETLAEGEAGILVLDRTPFYAESGGQVGDSGMLSNQSVTFTVSDTQKLQSAHLHHGVLTKGSISLGDKISSHVDVERRQAIKLNHSATHLLHAALQNILGQHVQQRGSLVDAGRLRLDFTHPNPLSIEEIVHIEEIVNQVIRDNIPAITEVQSLTEAKASGAQALFGEKYSEKVRVLTFGDFSKELCGGTHVERTGDIGLFKITTETSIASGVRRIEAVTGEHALAYVNNSDAQISYLAKQLKSPREAVQGKAVQLLARIKELEKNNQRLKLKLSESAGTDLESQVEDIEGVKVLLSKLDDVEPKALRNMVDQLKRTLKDVVIVLAVSQPNKVSLVAGVTDNLTEKVKAGELINLIATEVGGKGGGRADMAQAGGSQPEMLAQAFAKARVWLQEKLA